MKECAVIFHARDKAAKDLTSKRQKFVQDFPTLHMPERLQTLFAEYEPPRHSWMKSTAWPMYQL